MGIEYHPEPHLLALLTENVFAFIRSYTETMHLEQVLMETGKEKII